MLRVGAAPQLFSFNWRRFVVVVVYCGFTLYSLWCVKVSIKAVVY
jgi:hypothetical protein